MTKTFQATYDGKVLLPEEPLDLPPNTRVTVTIDGQSEEAPLKPYEGLRAIAALNIDGPPDSSERLHEYLYGVKRDGEA